MIQSYLIFLSGRGGQLTAELWKRRPLRPFEIRMTKNPNVKEPGGVLVTSSIIGAKDEIQKYSRDLTLWDYCYDTRMNMNMI